MTDRLTQIQRYAFGKATEKARIRGITVNGDKATVRFAEFTAPESDVEEYRKQDGTDGHYFYVIFDVWHSAVKSYWTGKQRSVEYIYLTDKAEGNEIFKKISATKAFDFEIAL